MAVLEFLRLLCSDQEREDEMKATNEQIADLRANTIKVAHVYQIMPVDSPFLISILDELLELRAKGEAVTNVNDIVHALYKDDDGYKIVCGATSGWRCIRGSMVNCDACRNARKIADPVTVGGGG